jgi:hypothetical protein
MVFFKYKENRLKLKFLVFYFGKKEIEEVDWKCVDKYGKCVYSIDLRFGNMNNYHQMIKDFKDLDSALEKIKVMIKGYVIITVNVW